MVQNNTIGRACKYKHNSYGDSNCSQVHISIQLTKVLLPNHLLTNHLLTNHLLTNHMLTNYQCKQ